MKLQKRENPHPKKLNKTSPVGKERIIAIAMKE